MKAKAKTQSWYREEGRKLVRVQGKWEDKKVQSDGEVKGIKHNGGWLGKSAGEEYNQTG